MREERSSKSSRRGAKKAPAAPFWRGAFEGKRGFRRIVMTGFAGLVAVGVPINALMLQEGPHPAPLFHLGPKGAAHGPGATASKDVPLPPARPASLVVAPAEAPPPPAKAEASKAPSKPFDAIGALLSGGAPPMSQAADKDKSVLFAQKALAKLGYGLHQDGVFGGTTRQAIEKFERANGMPVKGELTQKILRKLSAKSGLAMK
jgi:Putative peptidoglycan binding domain